MGNLFIHRLKLQLTSNFVWPKRIRRVSILHFKRREYRKNGFKWQRKVTNLKTSPSNSNKIRRVLSNRSSGALICMHPWLFFFTKCTFQFQTKNLLGVKLLPIQDLQQWMREIRERRIYISKFVNFHWRWFIYIYIYPRRSFSECGTPQSKSFLHIDI